MAIIQDNKELYKTVMLQSLHSFASITNFILFFILLLFLLFFFLKCLILCKSKAYERFWSKFKTLAGLSRAKKLIDRLKRLPTRRRRRGRAECKAMRMYVN